MTDGKTNVNYRVSNEDSQTVCSISGANAAVSPQAAAGFLRGVELIYGNGPCKGRLAVNTVFDFE